MFIPVEAVQVQIVNAWWEQLLPLLAILISVFSIGLTVYFRYVDRLNLVLDISHSMFVGDSPAAGKGKDRLNIRVTNKSPNLTTHITSLSLELPNGHRVAYTDLWPYDDKLPKALGPGDSASLSWPITALGKSLHGMTPKPRWVRALAVSGHKKVRGKRHPKLAATLRAYAITHANNR